MRMTTLSLRRPRALSISVPRPELAALLVLAGVLYLWALDRNGFANEYYSAAVRSMSTSWHAFLYGSFDAAGVMTVDKPPLALWIQALSARMFGFSSWSLLVPQALMGVATVALVYDLVRRRFGRAAGFVAGLALVFTPITVAIARHNNPDALLTLCCAGGRVGGGARARGRAHALDGAGRRRGRARLRGEDGRRAAGRARSRRRVAVGRSARAPPGAGRGRRGDGGGRARLAAAHVAHAGRRPAVDLRHQRQQHLVADPRLQRPRAAVRPGRRARRRHGRRDVRRRAGPAAAAQREPRRPGRMAAGRRARRRHRRGRAHAARPQGRPHRLADRGRRHVPHHGRRLQPRRGDLPPVLRRPARAVHGRPGRRRRGRRCAAAGSSRPPRSSPAWRPSWRSSAATPPGSRWPASAPPCCWRAAFLRRRCART